MTQEALRVVRIRNVSEKISGDEIEIIDDATNRLLNDVQGLQLAVSIDDIFGSGRLLRLDFEKLDAEGLPTEYWEVVEVKSIHIGPKEQEQCQ